MAVAVTTEGRRARTVGIDIVEKKMGARAEYLCPEVEPRRLLSLAQLEVELCGQDAALGLQGFELAEIGQQAL